jgi:hypothetical protein
MTPADQPTIHMRYPSLDGARMLFLAKNTGLFGIAGEHTGEVSE